MKAPCVPLRWILLLCLVGCARAGGYDPMARPAVPVVSPVDLEFTDAARERKLPVRVWMPPANERPAPVVLFSHGLGGNREAASYLAGHWSARGYAVVCLQHPGSDDAIWKEARAGERMTAVNRAASGGNLLLRAADVPAVLGQLEKWNKEKEHVLYSRLDMKRCGMSGHSFGAMTTQLLAGQTILGKSFTDPRIKAAIAFSPSPPRAGDAQSAFADVRMPVMLMTGTLDDSPVGNTTPEQRRLVFPALPDGDKYELVLDQARHNAFSDRRRPGAIAPRNPNHHKVILALSTAFWDAYLRGDPAAKAWLAGDRPQAIMEKADLWRKK